MKILSFCLTVMLCLSASLSAREEVSPSENIKYAMFSGYYMLQTAGKPVAYLADHAIERVDREAETAVIFIHEPVKETRNLMRFLMRILRNENAPKKRYFIMPMFFTDQTCPETLLLKVALWNKAPGVAWRSEGTPYNGQGPSSYEVIEMLCDHFSDSIRYPSLKRVILAGESRGESLAECSIPVGSFPRRKDLDALFKPSE